ncbi:histidine kinase [Rhodocytophaga rosea]|uniref:Histidine kinase n=1 Tax=Rhodocytophaga rosea TaxID=2704465 RepID=A0A6C0GCZ7_9BACT|nr:histidine kinase [Rhodocytophaga rosea]QHT65846.1 histidine kinase [Rhodocytophaga rosea]
MRTVYPLLHFAIKNKKQIAILSLATVALIIRLILFPEFGWQFQLLIFITSVISITIIWHALEYIDTVLNHRIPYEQGVFRRIIIQVAIGLVFLYLYMSMIFLLSTYVLQLRIDKIPRLLGYVIATLIILTINGGSIGAYFFKEWKKAILKSERLQRERTMVQFENLKNQLNPHFLFNSLTSLNSLIFENQQLASQFLQQLSKVYRYVLLHKEKELVNLETEIRFIENYVFLLETRFYGSLHVQIDIPAESRPKQIVPVTLQILIENAIKHNIVNEAYPLTIRIYTHAGYLCVENNLQKKSIIENSNKMGLENMKALYSFLSDQPMQISEDSNTFTVKIPLL